MGSFRAAPVLFWSSLALFLLVAHAAVPVPDRSMLWTAVANAGHAPLFAVFAVAMLSLSAPWSGRGAPPALRAYVLAIALTIAAGGVTELLQSFRHRDAEIQDLLRDALGGAAGLLCAYAWHQRKQTTRVKPPVLWAGFGAVLLFGVAFWSGARLTLAYIERGAAFPRICDFERGWFRSFVVLRSARLRMVEPPAEWLGAGATEVAQVTFLPGTEYPALILNEPYPDWRGYHRLVLDLYSDADKPITLILRIHDLDHRDAFSDRFNRNLAIQPGVNHLSVSLEDLRLAPLTRAMDLAHIRNLTLFVVDPPDTVSVLASAMYLE